MDYKYTIKANNFDGTVSYEYVDIQVNAKNEKEALDKAKELVIRDNYYVTEITI